ncbi:hypothetical protein NEF87_003306 [Candidatus Lokiarchaeum ossiferum]|uniref:Uncharacterized protein n=1 Tax=Candidatus Lokiarchaeum ossiferum TaxID=2951803 RepID=A0ABY6HU21_9ARCH|nr:hypothetical protein NEF87_003306 [Candidatus Lokiarchaeum sp. B-35]
MDEELKRAMEKGEILTLGEITPKVPVDVTSEILKDLDLSHQKIRYNFPIGIDFSKHISPAIYFPSMEILKKILEIPFLTTEDHYNLESLLLLLSQGKINRYRTTLLSMHSSEKQIAPQTPGLPDQQKSLIHLLVFLLSLSSSVEEKWLSKDGLDLYFQKKEKKSAQNNHARRLEISRSKLTLLQYTINIILREILKMPLNPSQIEIWVDIKNKILSHFYSKAEILVCDLLDSSVRPHFTVLSALVKNMSNSSETNQVNDQNPTHIKTAVKFFLPEIFKCLNYLIQ